MEEQPEGGAGLPDPEGKGAGEPAEAPRAHEDDARRSPVVGGLPDGPEARALAEEAAEIRRMVDAGAGSPEAIRELAARLREHRAREEALWRAEIKPTLRREGRGRFRGHARPGLEEAAAPPAGSQRLNLLAGIVVVLGLVVVAANTTIWVLILPVLGLLVWAWSLGRETGPD